MSHNSAHGFQKPILRSLEFDIKYISQPKQEKNGIHLMVNKFFTSHNMVKGAIHMEPRLWPQCPLLFPTELSPTPNCLFVPIPRFPIAICLPWGYTIDLHVTATPDVIDPVDKFPGIIFGLPVPATLVPYHKDPIHLIIAPIPDKLGPMVLEAPMSIFLHILNFPLIAIPIRVYHFGGAGECAFIPASFIRDIFCAHKNALAGPQIITEVANILVPIFAPEFPVAFFTAKFIHSPITTPIRPLFEALAVIFVLLKVPSDFAAIDTFIGSISV
jgi:hypothetical protein